MVFRNYVTQDVLRRIMTDYFGYDVHFVMNITDIDDKVRSLVQGEPDTCLMSHTRSFYVLDKTSWWISFMQNQL